MFEECRFRLSSTSGGIAEALAIRLSFVFVVDNTFLNLWHRFPVFKVKELIREVLTNELNDAEYHIDHSSKLTSSIADAIKNNLKQLNLSRFVWPAYSLAQLVSLRFAYFQQVIVCEKSISTWRHSFFCEPARYKLMVQVVIGQQKGEGVRMGTRCFWDAESDNYASDTFTNDSLFCVATAYGVYMY